MFTHPEKFLLGLRLSLGDRALQDLASVVLAGAAIIAVGAALSLSPDLTAPGLKSLIFPFALFSGASVLTVAVTRDRARGLAIGGLAAIAALLELILHPATPGLGLILWAAAAFGIVTGPALIAAWERAAPRLARPKLQAPVPNDPAAAAADWFVRLHREDPDHFDWGGFERWICASRAHRQAYDQIEALWYEADIAREAQGADPVAQPLSQTPAARLARLFGRGVAALFGDDRRLALMRLCAVTLFWTMALASLRG